MKRIRVRVVVDPDAQRQYSITHPAQIEFYVVGHLNDPDGWASEGYFFEPVSMNQDVLIRLSTNNTVSKECGFSKKLSCAEIGGKTIWINADRWFHGAPKSRLPLGQYRQYLVSHEMGHILGHDHETCPCKGCRAPIMMQQTLGIGECVPNTKV